MFTVDVKQQYNIQHENPLIEAILINTHNIPFSIQIGKPSYSILLYPMTLEGRRGTTDEFTTIPFHFVLFSAALVELAKSIPVHCLILSSHLFFCLPLFLFPFIVPCRIVFVKPVQFPLFLQASLNVFRNQAQCDSKGQVLFLFCLLT